MEGKQNPTNAKTIGDIAIRIQGMQKKTGKRPEHLTAPTKRKFLIDFNTSETKTSIVTSKKNPYIIKFKITILVTYIFKI